MKPVISILIMVAGLALMVYLALYIMLYGGIMQAVNSWGVDKSAVVWGIIMAVFSELGVIPGAILFGIGFIGLKQ